MVYKLCINKTVKNVVFMEQLHVPSPVLNIVGYKGYVM